jgi:hypothetical protein
MSTHPVAATVLQVGPGQTYATLAAANAAASAGDTIDVHGGPAGYQYLDQSATVSKALTITGVDDGSGLPVFNLTPGTQMPGLKGFLVVQADALVSNLVFKNAFIDGDHNTYPGGNAAGIRQEAGNLTVQNVSFIGNQNGILATPGTPNTGTLTILNSTFVNNGSGDGYTHAIYANQLSQVTVSNTSFQGTKAGHDVKSRAAETIVTNSTLDDGVTGTASYAIDLSNGGNGTISGNLIVQGPNTQNPVMVAYGAEGLIWSSNTVSITGNSFVNFRDFGTTTGVRNFQSSGADLSITGNSFCGLTQDVSGPATASGNTSSPGPCSLPAPPLGLAWAGALLVLGLLGRRVSPA